jgi:hypothetical protein
MNERTESPEMNLRINTLIMRGLSAAEAEAQAKWESGADESPVTVRRCELGGCVITSPHKHGI